MPPLFQRQEELSPGLMQRAGNAATAARYALFGYPGVGQVERALNPDPQVTNRASMLPIGNYDDGSVGLAWPQSLIDAKEAFGRFQRGEAPQPQDAVLAGLAMTGGMFVPKPSNTVGMFGGRLARTADHAKLAQAEEMAARGAPREDIWKQTGWFKGSDDKWRFEIDDSGQRLNKTMDELDELGRPLPSSMVFKHDALHAAYPEVGEIPWYRTPELEGGGASYDPVRGIRLSSAPSFASGKSGPGGMTLHEQQHAIQGIEDFARGGSREFGNPQDLVKREAQTAYEAMRSKQVSGVRTADDDLLAELGMSGPTLTKPWDELTPREQLEWFDAGRGRVYNKLAGEVEARNVQARMNMSADERRATPPWLTQDVADEDQIVKLFSNPKEAAPAGLLATSNLDRMKAAESAPARSIPDAPQSIPELQGMIDSNLDRFAVSRSVGDQAFSQDPARYNAYAYGLHDVMNPDSEWMLNSPTLQSGGLVPFGTSAPGLMQPPAQPDAPGLMAQQRPSDRLQERGYLDKVPPAVVTQDAMGDDQIKAYENYIRSRVETMNAMGVPYWEARRLIEEMPDATSYRQRLTQESLQDPKMQDEIRNLLERLR